MAWGGRGRHYYRSSPLPAPNSSFHMSIGRDAEELVNPTSKKRCLKSRTAEHADLISGMPPVSKKPSAAPAQAQTAPAKNTAIVKAATAAKVAPPAKNAALAAVAAAMAAAAAGAAPQKVSSSDQMENEDTQAPRRWIVKKTLNKFKANLRSVPDYYLPKFIQLVAAEVAPRCDGDQPLSRYLKYAGMTQKEDMIIDSKIAKPKGSFDAGGPKTSKSIPTNSRV